VPSVQHPRESLRTLGLGMALGPPSAAERPSQGATAPSALSQVRTAESRVLTALDFDSSYAIARNRTACPRRSDPDSPSFPTVPRPPRGPQPCVSAEAIREGAALGVGAYCQDPDLYRLERDAAPHRRGTHGAEAVPAGYAAPGAPNSEGRAARAEIIVMLVRLDLGFLDYNHLHFVGKANCILNPNHDFV
jgi:hypothetical protein